MTETTTIKIELENLDAMEIDDLQAHLDKIRTAIIALQSYQRYGIAKHRAMELRIDGRINEAMNLERRCDTIL